MADLTPAQRTRLSEIASRVVAADARRRGIDIHATPAGDGLWGGKRGRSVGP